jgi:UDP-N-acetylmuramate: L-alanyl-gamma-D-glutamyl-meso-diaminopimelate ligase
MTVRGSTVVVSEGEVEIGPLDLPLPGRHNLANALAAIAAARHIGIAPGVSIAALAGFSGIRRRLELRGAVREIAVYDDFAHHPTAIRATIDALREQARADERILAVLEMRSNTMRAGYHRDTLAASLGAADAVFVYAPEDLDWSVEEAMLPLGARCQVATSVEAIVENLVRDARPGDQILVMSNGSFEGIHGRILEKLERDHD